MFLFLVVVVVCYCRGVVVVRVGGLLVGPLPADPLPPDPPPTDRPNFRAFFFSSPAPMFALCVSLSSR